MITKLSTTIDNWKIAKFPKQIPEFVGIILMLTHKSVCWESFGNLIHK